MKKTIFLILFFFSTWLSAQSNQINENDIVDHFVERMEIKNGGFQDLHTSIKNYSRFDLIKMIKRLRDNQNISSAKDEFLIDYLIEENKEFLVKKETQNGGIEKKFVDSTDMFYTLENNEDPIENEPLRIKDKRPLFKYFYKTSANFFEIEEPNFTMYVNPILNVKFGKDLHENNNVIFQNTRGIEVRGLIDYKVYFYTNLIENQGQFNDHIIERIIDDEVIPGFGNYKGFKSGISDKFQGYDFPNSQGYVGFNISKHIGLEFGHGRHNIGNGIRSLLLSNYAQNYFYLKFSTRVWKLHYQNLFAELAPLSARLNPGDNLLPKKYMTNHYLSFKPKKNLEIGIYETVLFSRENQFELQYLNPVIFYRTIEFFLDSPDNVIIGANFNWIILKQFSIYGQMVLDEFYLSEIKANTGWWANKYGGQFGFKYIDALNIDQLDIQLEYNSVRPYTYSHRLALEENEDISLSNFSHYSQSLAHPLGSNFREIVLDLKYRPTEQIFIDFRFNNAIYGEDRDGQNWGGDILKPHTTRVMDQGNEIAQGVRAKVNAISLDLSYMLYHNYFFDIHLLYRTKDSELDEYDLTTKYFGAGFRANISNLKIDY